MTIATHSAHEAGSDGQFLRQGNFFTGRITADGSSGFPAEPGRYVLYASLACPWAHRALIVRRLLGLEDVIDLSIVDPIRDERGWRFGLDTEGRDPVTGVRYLAELYHRTSLDYRGRVTVPCVWDKATGTLVTNDFHTLTTTMETEFAAFHAEGAPDLYPVALRAEIDALNAVVYRDVNNGVYRAGFARSQAAYDAAYRALFARLYELEKRLTHRRFLLGDHITEADVRLFPTLVRFDAVYHGHFKCNRNKLTEARSLWRYARDLFSTPGFGDTTNFDHIKRHYYKTQGHLNPTGIVPNGPDLSGWLGDAVHGSAP